MTSADLRLAEADSARLYELCKPSFRAGRCPETGAIGIVSECRAGDRHEFLVVKLLPPGPGDLKVAAHDHLVFDASYIRRAHLQMRGARLVGLVLFHTHPGSDRRSASRATTTSRSRCWWRTCRNLIPRPG